jgi:hypothetical protein
MRQLESVDMSRRVAASYWDGNEIQVQVSFSSAYSGNLELYALDADNAGRRETVTVGDQTANLDGDFSRGAWIIFPVNVAAGSSLTIKVDHTAGPNAVLAGIFLGGGGSPPPLPASSVCTKVLDAGGDVQSFVNSLAPGDVGCLHGGTYTGGTMVTWTASGTSTAPVTVTSYPGEQAEIVGTTFYLEGSYQVMRDLTVRDVTYTDGDGIAVSGNGNRVEHNVVTNIYRDGILLHTDASNAVIAGNDVSEVGQAGSNQDHGIYVQGDGHLVINNVFSQIRGGYGIHVYPSSSNITIAQNTVVNSQTRSGILIDTTGGNIIVVNNIVTDNVEYGISNNQCGLGGCLVDHNLAWNNGFGATSGPATNTIQADPLYIDSAYHVASNSPAVNAARSDYSYSPDRDGTPRPQSGAPDIGAYEQ